MRVHRFALATVVVAAAVLLTAACGGDGDDEAAPTTTAAPTTAPDTRSSIPKSAADVPPLAAGKTYEIVFDTNKGSFSIRVDQKVSPNVSASMVALARGGFFDGTICHRIIPGFVIQCGDPTGTGTGGPGYSTQDDVPASVRYTKGVVAMAKTQTEPPGTSGSQFFIVTGADVGLPTEYAFLGVISEGIDTVDAIAKLGDPATEMPTERVEIEKATVVESG